MAINRNEILHIEIAELDYLIIQRVREMRQSCELTQLQLSQKMRLSDGFVSKVETLTERAKYSIRHLPLIAMAFNCELREILPRDTPKNDIIKITLKRHYKSNRDGTTSRKAITEIIKIEPIIESKS